MRALVLALILWPATVTAQPDWLANVAVGAYMTSAGADLAITTYGLGAGAFQEGNPLLKPFEDRPIGMAVVKMGLGSVLSYTLLKRRHSSKRAVILTAIGLTALNSWVVWRNARLLRSGGGIMQQAGGH